ncbi:MAG: hypothetical protein CBD49_01090 [Acidimicrobiaceae bacterium TMED189]|nr:MAG: hypothetical protein CBD49_01090 [Acidimicrobiaceae bacterium TMED189]|tara:strand:- start:571 stop:1869 length:1299 start_codon:yes stop_codon:yes gene_type:complete
MVDFAYPHEATAGQAIEASKHNDNWNRVKNFINGDPGNLASYPGLLRAVDPSATGTLTSGAITCTGTVSLGATNHLYLNSTQHSVIGLSTGTDINAETAGSFLKDLAYRANFLSTSAPGGVAGPGNNVHWLSNGADIAAPAADAGNYFTEAHRYSVYSRRAGEGYAGAAEARPESEYRLVVNGSIAIRGDIIGYSNKNESVPGTSSDYGLGLGTRIDCQWLNVGANVDIGGELRVQTRFDSAKIYMGNDYYVSEDYIEWKDNLDGSSLPGFQFVHNSNKMLQISESGVVGSEKLDLRAYKASAGASQGGWPTLSGTTAVITTTGTEQLGIQSSSIRFKEDVEDLGTEENWTKLRALKPRAFRWNEEVATQSGMNYETQVPELGFIAEEVHEAVPEATMYDWSGDPIVYRDKSMLAMLVKAVQDLDDRMGALE